MSWEATQAPTSLFTAHCTLCEKCPLRIRSHETYRNYPTTSQASLHLNTTHCKLIWGIPKSIHMKCTQINREITACPRSHPERERERERWNLDTTIVSCCVLVCEWQINDWPIIGRSRAAICYILSTSACCVIFILPWNTKTWTTPRT